MKPIKEKNNEQKQKFISFVKTEVTDKNHLLFSAFVVALTSIVVINTIFWIDRSNIGPIHIASGQTITPKVLSTQLSATNSAYTVAISNVTEQNKFDPAFTIAKDETVLLFDIKITNHSPGNQDLIPVNQLYVRDRTGGYYPMHVSSLVTKPLPASALKPGESASGQVSFVVPKSLAHPLLYVDLGWDDLVPSVFDVLK